VFEPTAEKAQAIEVLVSADSCGWKSGNKGGHFTVQSVELDVLGAH